MGNIRGGLHGTVGQSSAQLIEGSLKFDKDTNHYLSWTPSSDGDRDNWTISCWIKRGKIGTANQRMFESGSTAIRFGSDVFQWIDGGSGNNGENTPAAKIRDPEWYHLVFAWDSSAGVLGNRIYVNGVELQYVQTGGGNPSGNSAWNTGSQVHTIGRNAGNTGRYYDGMMTQCYFIDGQTLGPVGFGFTDPLTNTWRPKKYTGTFGTNGFWLPMDNQDDFEKDKSGNGNHWTKNNFSGTFNNPDVVKDSPSGTAFGGPPTTGITTTSSTSANYATLNPLDPRGLGNSPTFSEGNRRINSSSSYDVVSTIGADSGRWYWEVEMIDVGTTICGIIDIHNGRSSQFSMSSPTVYYATTRNNGTREGNQSGGTNFTYTDGDIVAWALDVDNLKLYGYKNGSLQSTATITQTDITWSPYVYGESTTDHRFNFGQKPFKYAPPEGFLPLNSASVRPETVIPLSNQYVGVTTYTGTSASTATVTSENIKFTPDFVWCKYRDGTEGHALYDSVRGPLYRLRSNTNDQQTTGSNELKSFIPGGFTTGNNGHIYYNGYDFVSWMWKAGGAKGTFNVDDKGYASASAAGITDGTIALTGCSVGTKQGFSILKYAGSGSNGTLAHGLSQAPDFFFGRDLEDTGGTRDWIIYHKDVGNTGRLKFTDASTSTSSTFFQDTSPTNSLITVGTSNDINSTNDHILYCFHNVPGLQKFGTYEGNNDSDGPFVELGFNPAIIWTKGVDSASHGWEVHWNSGPSLRVNPQSERLMLNETAAKATTNHVDFLSNGFKIRNTFSGMNSTSDTYIYCAWADVPSFNLYGAQSNAR